MYIVISSEVIVPISNPLKMEDWKVREAIAFRTDKTLHEKHKVQIC